MCMTGCDLILGGIEREEDDDPDLIAQGLCSNTMLEARAALLRATLPRGSASASNPRREQRSVDEEDGAALPKRTNRSDGERESVCVCV
jgi:hypothetical protein